MSALLIRKRKWSHRANIATLANTPLSLISNDLVKRADSRYAIEFYGSSIGSDYNKYLNTCGEDGSFRHYKMVMNAHLLRVS